MVPIWLMHYPQGIPAEVDCHRFASLKEMLEQCCERFSPRPAFTNIGGTTGVAERWQQVMGVSLIKGYGLTEVSPSSASRDRR